MLKGKIAGKKSGKNSKKIVIGNWKMNPSSVAYAKRIILATRATARTLDRTVVVSCPPFPFLVYALPKANSSRSTSSALSTGPEMLAGAQNVSFEESGAFTGEVSAQMLADMGLSHVIVGHSERRKMGESDADVAKKAVAVAQAGMIAVACVGEEVRDQEGVYLNFLKEQIKNSLTGFSKKNISEGKLIIAYEPIWAIGAKEAMTPAAIHEMNIFIKKTLSDLYGQTEALAVPILYGGSVNFRNAADIVNQGDVDGLLVGRESVNQPGFSELLKAVDAPSSK